MCTEVSMCRILKWVHNCSVIQCVHYVCVLMFYTKHMCTVLNHITADPSEKAPGSKNWCTTVQLYICAQSITKRYTRYSHYTCALYSSLYTIRGIRGTHPNILVYECNMNVYVYTLYIQSFHKTLPKSSLQMHWISVRFDEMGDICTLHIFVYSKLRSIFIFFYIYSSYYLRK